MGARFMLVLGFAFVTSVAPVHALPWNPPGLVASPASLAASLAQIPAAHPAPGGRIERVRMLFPPQSAAATVAVRADDYRIDIGVDGSVYEVGSADGVPWRRLPSGLMHIVKSDVQSDELDRWPRALYGFRVADCSIAGETRGPNPLVVVRDAPPDVAVHWFFVDPRSGDVVREMMRDGVHVTTFTFGDVRIVDGVRRPFRWHVEGDGPVGDVVVDDVRPATLADADLAPLPPPPASDAGDERPSTHLDALFRNGRIIVWLRVNGHQERFVLDDGTTEMTMSRGGAEAAGLHVTFGHAIARTIDVDGVVMHDVPVLVVPELVGIGGLLANDFFAAHIVHVNFRTRSVDVLPRPAFAPPADARAVPIDVREGLPLARVRVGSQAGDRFALDLGSDALLLSEAFAGPLPSVGDAIGFRSWVGPPATGGFLEGPVTTERATVGEVTFGGSAFPIGNEVAIERSGHAMLPLPIDGVVGTDVLSKFELWFDYPANVLYVRPY